MHRARPQLVSGAQSPLEHEAHCNHGSITWVPSFSLPAVGLSRRVYIRGIVSNVPAWCPGDPKSCLTRERVSAEPAKEALSIRWGWHLPAVMRVPRVWTRSPWHEYQLLRPLSLRHNFLGPSEPGMRSSLHMAHNCNRRRARHLAGVISFNLVAV